MASPALVAANTPALVTEKKPDDGPLTGGVNSTSGKGISQSFEGFIETRTVRNIFFEKKNVFDENFSFLFQMKEKTTHKRECKKYQRK